MPSRKLNLLLMDSGTENMDWVSRALLRIIQFTQAGGEINIVVNGINVGDSHTGILALQC